jgi:hypothetical protein
MSAFEPKRNGYGASATNWQPRAPDFRACGYLAADRWATLRHSPIESLIENSEVTMAKGQMRSNREKKKPKQDKNKKKGAEASSPFTGMHSQVKPSTSYASQYGKKH